MTTAPATSRPRSGGGVPAAPSRSSSSAPSAPPYVIPDTVEELLGDEYPLTARPWIVIVWDDPVNLMSYVVLVFQKVFGYSREKATRLMLQVHNEGKSVVSDGTREECEVAVARLHGHGLWATLEQST